MALTDTELATFQGPAIWGESDCIAWLSLITGLRPRRLRWSSVSTEAQALALARQLHGSYTAAVLHELRCHGYRRLRSPGRTYQKHDVVMVDDLVHGELPAGVFSGPTLVLRHAQGIAIAHGQILWHLRRS